MSLRISLKKGSMSEVLNRGLDAAVIQENNRCKNREIGRGSGEGLSIKETYTQVQNASGIYLRYSQIL